MLWNTQRIPLSKELMPNYSISKTERVLLLAFASCSFLFFAVGISAEAIDSYNQSVEQYQKELARQAGLQNIISFAVDGFFYSIPLFNLITFPILLALIRPGRYVVSFALTLMYLGLLILMLISRLDGRGLFGTENFFTDPLKEFWIKTTFSDQLALFVVAVMIIWQGSILFRRFLHDRKNAFL